MHMRAPSRPAQNSLKLRTRATAVSYLHGRPCGGRVQAEKAARPPAAAGKVEARAATILRMVRAHMQLRARRGARNDPPTCIGNALYRGGTVRIGVISPDALMLRSAGGAAHRCAHEGAHPTCSELLDIAHTCYCCLIYPLAAVCRRRGRRDHGRRRARRSRALRKREWCRCGFGHAPGAARGLPCGSRARRCAARRCALVWFGCATGVDAVL